MKKVLVALFAALFLTNLGVATASVLPIQQKKLSFSVISAKDLKAVVNISTSHTVTNKSYGNFHNFFRGGNNDPFNRFFGQFFRGLPNMPRKYIERSLGSGFIITPNGFILTNDHVIDKADTIKVRLPNGRIYKGKVIGADKKTDIALVKIDAKNLPTIKLGNSGKMQIGDPVLAIGNPFGLNGTVTSGIISAKGRVIGEAPYDHFLQTDAAINPGNSGGPLVNIYGNAIGINTAIIASGQGIGFAIPINMVKELLPQLRKGHIERGYLGVYMQRITVGIQKAFNLKNRAGALVSEVVKGKPAASAGIKRGDVIIKVDGKKITGPTDLAIVIGAYPPRTHITIALIRNGKTIYKSATLATLGNISKNRSGKSLTSSNKKLGIDVAPLTPSIKSEFRIDDSSGVVITGILPGSIASQSGLSPGDVILRIDRKQVKNIADFNKLSEDALKKSPILLLIHRGRSTIYVTIDTK